MYRYIILAYSISLQFFHRPSKVIQLYHPDIQTDEKLDDAAGKCVLLYEDLKELRLELQ